MEILLNELMKLGVRKREIAAKVFGGGSVLRLGEGARGRIPQGNIDFAFEYLAKEGIPVLASDVGGREPRKIFFFARSGKVLLKRIGNGLAGLVEKEEERYLEVIRAKEREGPVVLFDERFKV
jgi:chemotaxis protein CheD